MSLNLSRLSKKQSLFIMIGIVITIVLLLLLGNMYGRFIKIQVASLPQYFATGYLKTDTLDPGMYTLKFTAQNATMSVDTSTTFQIASSGGGDGGRGGGSGGDEGGRGGGGGSEEVIPVPRSASIVTRAATSGVTLAGNTNFSSENLVDGTRNVVMLAAHKAIANYVVQLRPETRYELRITAKHDAPGPVKALVILNNKPWKQVSWKQGNNTYAQQLVGILTAPRSGALKIGIQFRNDYFSCSSEEMKDGTLDIACDRNLYIHKIELKPVVK